MSGKDSTTGHVRAVLTLHLSARWGRQAAGRPVRARQARENAAAEPYRSATLAVPPSAVEVVDLIWPPGVKASVKELSVLATASSGPRQMPEKATSKGSALGEPPARSTDVLAPAVDHQVCTWPDSAKL